MLKIAKFTDVCMTGGMMYTLTNKRAMRLPLDVPA